MLFLLCNIYNIKHITINPIKSACFIYRRQGNYFGKILAKQQKHFVFRQVLEPDGITVTTMVSDSDMTFCTHANENIWIPLIDDIRSERHNPCSCAIEFFSTDVIIILSSERRYENPRDTSFSLFIINLLSWGIFINGGEHDNMIDRHIAHLCWNLNCFIKHFEQNLCSHGPRVVSRLLFQHIGHSDIFTNFFTFNSKFFDIIWRRTLSFQWGSNNVYLSHFFYCM
jgi:hypothetical protein